MVVDFGLGHRKISNQARSHSLGYQAYQLMAATLFLEELLLLSLEWKSGILFLFALIKSAFSYETLYFHFTRLFLEV